MHGRIKAIHFCGLSDVHRLGGQRKLSFSHKKSLPTRWMVGLWKAFFARKRCGVAIEPLLYFFFLM
jgi:hypothetical protein